MKTLLANYPYIAVIAMVCVGLYILSVEKNLIKKVIGLNLLQTGVILFYVLLAKIDGGIPPVIDLSAPVEPIYSNPLPHVLMLTAIVVGIATTSLAYALIYRIKKAYSSIDEAKLMKINSSKKEV